DASGLTIVDGAREIRRAVESGVEVIEAFVHDEAMTSSDAEAAVANMRASGARITPIGPLVLEKLAFGNRGDGIVVVVRVPATRIEELRLSDEPLVAVVEGVEKPGNLGAIIRTADGAGVDALIAADARTDLFNPATIRASLGTIFALPVVAATTAETLAWLRARRLRMVVARVDADLDYADADLTGAVAIVFGSEAGGLSEAWSGSDVQAVRLAMLGAADSLNVSATAAVLFYEALRQRKGVQRPS